MNDSTETLIVALYGIFFNCLVWSIIFQTPKDISFTTHYYENTKLEADPKDQLVHLIQERFGPTKQNYIKQIVLIVEEKTEEIEELDPCLVLGIIGTESSFKELKVFTPYGQGPMQVTKFWAAEYKIKPIELLDVETNIEIGVDIFHNEYNQNLSKYNGYATKGYATKVLDNYSFFKKAKWCKPE